MAMNSTGGMSQRASMGAADWAQKRKDQMERARLLREERKSGGGSGALKNAANDFVHRQSSNGRSQQHTQMSSMNPHDVSVLSAGSNNYPNNGGSGRAFGSSSPSVGYQSGYNPNQMPGQGASTPNIYQQPGGQRQGNQNGMNEFLPQTGYSSNSAVNQNQGGGQHSFYNQFQQNQQNAPSHSNLIGQNHYPPHLMSPQPPMGGGSIDNGGYGMHATRTQDNYYQGPPTQTQYNQMSPIVPRQQNPGYGGQHNTIGHDGQSATTPTSGSQFGGYQDNNRTQDFNMPGDRSNRHNSGGGLTPLPLQRQTTYSQRDVEEARGSLTLLKKRMNSRERRQDSGDVLSADGTRNHFGGMNQGRVQQNGMQAQSVQHLSQQKPNTQTQNQFGNVRLSGQFNHVPKPPRPQNGQPLYEDSSAAGDSTYNSTNGATGGAAANRNYRKVFKPQINQNAENSNNLDAMNNMALGASNKSTGQRSLTQEQSPQQYKPSVKTAPPRNIRKQPEWNNDTEEAPQDFSQNASPDRANFRNQEAEKSRFGAPRSSNKPVVQDRTPPARNPPAKRVPPRAPPQDYYEQQEEPPSYGGMGGDEGDPFGSKSAARVANTPPKGQRAPQQQHAQPQEQPDDQPPEYAQSNQNRVPCNICGRQFGQDKIEKHEGICAKTNAKKRKVFNAKAAREATDATGAGIEKDPYAPPPRKNFPGSKKPPAKAAAAAPTGSEPKKIPKWKLQSMQFRQAVGPLEPKGGAGAGGFNPTMEASAAVDDRIDCPYCGRKFSEIAGERHIPHCETKHKANQMKMGPPRGGSKPPLRGKGTMNQYGRR